MATVRNLFCSPFIYRRQYMKMKKPAIRIVLIAAIVAVVLLIALAVAAGAENLSAQRSAQSGCDRDGKRQNHDDRSA